MSYNYQEAVGELKRRGYLAVDVDPTLDFEAEIIRLKKEKNAVILARLS